MSHRLFEVICVGNLCMYTGISPRGFVNNVLFLALSLYLSLPLSYSCCTSGRRKRIKPRLLELNVNSTFIGLCCWSRCCCCCCCFCWATEEGLRRVHRTKCCVSLQDVPVAIAATTVALSAASIHSHRHHPTSDCFSPPHKGSLSSLLHRSSANQMRACTPEERSKTASGAALIRTRCGWC